MCYAESLFGVHSQIEKYLVECLLLWLQNGKKRKKVLNTHLTAIEKKQQFKIKMLNVDKNKNTK